MNRKAQLQQLIDNHANDAYIQISTGHDLDTITKARQGIYGPEFDPKLVKHRKKPLEPATRPFPVLTPDMTDGERILALTKHGLSARKLKKYLHNPTMSEKSIGNYVLKKLGPMRKGNASVANWIGPSFKPYVIEALRLLGKNPYICEICLESVPKGCVIHHTKYEGATVYDLMYICMSCNLSRENKGLS